MNKDELMQALRQRVLDLSEQGKRLQEEVKTLNEELAMQARSLDHKREEVYRKALESDRAFEQAKALRDIIDTWPKEGS